MAAQSVPDDNASSDSESVHPVVWAAIGGGIVAVGALILGLVLSVGDNSRLPEVVPAVGATPTHADPPSVVQNDVEQLRNKSVQSKETKAEADSPPASVVLPAKSTVEAERPSIVEHSPAPPPPLSAEDLYARVSPSVVTVEAKDESGEDIATGSGFFIDENSMRGHFSDSDFWYDKRRAREHTETDKRPTEAGYVITNYHVIRSSVNVEIILNNGDKGSTWGLANVDEQADLALLRVTAPSTQPFKGLAFAAADPRVGATVYAIGSPQGLSATLSPGIVSSLRELDPGSHWLQTTAPISPGSSGGPLLLANGTIAGVTTLTSKHGQNLNFAIPASKVLAFLSAEYRPQFIGEGVSVQEHWYKAFSDAINQLRYGGTNANPKAEDLLIESFNELARGYGHYEKAIANASEADKIFPNELKYITAYIIGRSSCAIAARDRFNNHAGIVKNGLEANYRTLDSAKIGQRNLEKAAMLKDDFAPVYYELAVHYQHGGQWPEALIASDRLVKLMPRCADAFELRAACYGELDRPAAEKSDLETAIELSPRNGNLYCRLGSVLDQLGEYDASVKAYESSLTASENKFPATLAYYNIGNVYKVAGNFTKALSAFEQAKAEGYPNPAEIDRLIQECKHKLQQ